LHRLNPQRLHAVAFSVSARRAAHFSVSGHLTVDGGAIVSSALDTPAVTVNGDVALNGDLAVNGAIAVDGIGIGFSGFTPGQRVTASIVNGGDVTQRGEDRANEFCFLGRLRLRTRAQTEGCSFNSSYTGSSFARVMTWQGGSPTCSVSTSCIRW
jgi:hypothetical protein